MADRYWVGGTGTWDNSDTTHWATSTGGASGASVPTSSDNVIFDTLSNATGYTVTVSSTATKNCLDLTIGAPLTGTLTFAGSGTSAFNIYGNFVRAATNVSFTYTGRLTFKATSGTVTINTNGLSSPNTYTFDGVGGTFQLASNIGPINNGNTNAFVLTNGTFDANGKTVTLGSGVCSINGTFTGSNAFYNLTKNTTTAKTDQLLLTGDLEVTNTFTCNGNSKTNRVHILSNTIGTARTITAATVTVNAADFQDITGAGAGSWDLSAVSNYSGDCGGNSGITFTSPVTTDCSAGTTWSTATWSSRVPLPQDTATFSGVARTITQDMPRIGSVDFTGSNGSITWTTSTTCTCYGSLNLTNLGTLTGSTESYTFSGRSSYTINLAGKSLAKNVTISAFGGTYTLTNQFDSTVNLTVSRGTFNSAGYPVNVSALVSNSTSLTRTLTLGASVVTISGSTGLDFHSSMTFNANTSRIIFTSSNASALTFNGGDQTFNSVTFARGASTAAINISGSNTFGDLIDIGTAAHSQVYTVSTTNTVGSFTANGSAGNEITLNSSTTGTFALVKSGNGTIACDYLNIQHCVATPSNTWYAGTHSTDNQSTATAGSGWIFTNPVYTANIALESGNNLLLQDSTLLLTQ